MPTQEELAVRSIGPAEVPSPLLRQAHSPEFVSDGVRVLFETEFDGPPDPADFLLFEKAGPRERVFFDPERTTAAMVTCGGLSPGLNNVLRSAYMELTHNYGVPRVLGIRNGYRGLNPNSGSKPIELTPDFVHDIHHLGGSVLGSSRGPQEPRDTVDFLESQAIDILLCVGGDGTQRGAHAIAEEIDRRGLPKSVVGIPKTIDNDVPYVWMTFGYLTALEKAQEVIRGAHAEAIGAPNGVALVKLMGRDAGFIAAGAALASQDANFVLVPESEFPLEGERGLLEALENRLAERGHAVIVAAEGAGQHLLKAEPRERDASGNLKQADIGSFLREKIRDHFEEKQIELNLKYMDPSYLIRSVPANPWDRIVCDRMARAAVHAGMAGKTDVTIGWWNGSMIHVPISVITATKRQMSLSDDLWAGVLSATGQPRW